MDFLFVDAVRARVDALEGRLASTSSCALPYVDIVAVRAERAWSWSRGGRVCCAVLALEDDRGASRTQCLTGPDDRIATAWVEHCFERDVTGVARQVWDDWQGAARTRMAALVVTPATVAAETARRLGPWLEHYRRIRVLGPRVAAFEALAAEV